MKALKALEKPLGFFLYPLKALKRLVLSTNQLQIMKWILCHAASQGLFYLLNQCFALLLSCRSNLLEVHVQCFRFCNSYVGTNDQTTPMRKTKLEFHQDKILAKNLSAK